MYKRSIAALVWLLTVAIPLQGIAAAAMTHCGSHQHAAGSAQTDHERHDHDAAVLHEAYGGGAHTHQSMSDADADASSLEHDGNTKCSACAACCLGLAVPSSSSARLPMLPTVAAHSVVFASALEVVITGPERPPRLFLV